MYKFWIGLFGQPDESSYNINDINIQISGNIRKELTILEYFDAYICHHLYYMFSNLLEEMVFLKEFIETVYLK